MKKTRLNLLGKRLHREVALDVSMLYGSACDELQETTDESAFCKQGVTTTVLVEDASDAKKCSTACSLKGALAERVQDVDMLS